MKHYPFPRIQQSHQVIKAMKLQCCYVGKNEDGEPIYDNSIELPTVTFQGHVKLHGTNAAIVFNSDGSYYCQSRENIIDEIKDNAGFAHWVAKEGYKLREMIPPSVNSQTVIYGEWCGGSIQKGVAISKLPKMFVVFGIKIVTADGESQWQDSSNISDAYIDVYHISKAPSFKISIDLNRPDIAIETMTKWVDEIYSECPFGKMLGVSGHGEGIVFRPINDHGFDCAFKVKGESYSKSKTQKLPTVDCAKMDSIQQVVETHCHEDRLEQGGGAVIKKSRPLVPSQTPTTMNEDILEEAMRITSVDRQNQYGPPDQDFTRTAAMWTALKGVKFEARDVAMFMICLKLSRETHQKNRDSAVDIAGYARCLHLCNEADQKRSGLNLIENL